MHHLEDPNQKESRKLRIKTGIQKVIETIFKNITNITHAIVLLFKLQDAWQAQKKELTY